MVDGGHTSFLMLWVDGCWLLVVGCWLARCSVCVVGLVYFQQSRIQFFSKQCAARVCNKTQTSKLQTTVAERTATKDKEMRRNTISINATFIHFKLWSLPTVS